MERYNLMVIYRMRHFGSHDVCDSTEASIVVSVCKDFYEAIVNSKSRGPNPQFITVFRLVEQLSKMAGYNTANIVKIKPLETEGKETRVERVDCIYCGGKKSMELWQYRNPEAKRWKTSHGQCSICGARIVV